MNLPTLILTAIKRSSHGLTGYDITSQIKGSWNAFWSASHQQVYRDLDKATEQGYLTPQHVAQEGKPDKIIYSLTAAGEEYLAGAASTVIPLSTTRDRFSAQLMAMEGSCTDKSELIKEHMLLCQARKTELGTQLDHAINEGDEINELIIQKQLQEVSATINWAEMAVLRLRKRDAS